MLKTMLIATASIPAILALGKLATRHGYESAAYEVLEREGDFEVRRYESHQLAETSMTSFERDRGSFRRLFEYIRGANERSEELAMTTPVFMEQSRDNRAGSMAFVVPREVAAKGAPGATSGAVTVRTLEAHVVASLRFRGFRDERRIREAEARLRAWMAERGLEPSSAPRLAFYDPPWTPELLRRNEIQIPVMR